MNLEKKLGRATVRIVRGDVTKLEVDAFVFYAQHDLGLGSGFGAAIAQRAGPSVAQELQKLGALATTQAVITGAGELPAKHIIHAVGPRFQESGAAEKLRATLETVLGLARAAKIARLALPPLGVGFYGVPLPLSARVTMATLGEQLPRHDGLQEVVICCTDTRDVKAFETALQSM